ncbi:MAG TPA: hypothetical protein VLB46_13000 [Pyrinomonadaceae bacterium]|nr:hypothetical protein [Pyrinomonadaceae bacterium]
MHELQDKAAEWNVALEEIRETPTSLLGLGMRHGARVVLKISKQVGDESHSGEVLPVNSNMNSAHCFATPLSCPASLQIPSR